MGSPRIDKKRMPRYVAKSGALTSGPATRAEEIRSKEKQSRAHSQKRVITLPKLKFMDDKGEIGP